MSVLSARARGASALAAATLLTAALAVPVAAAPEAPVAISDTARQQIQALLDEKESRTPAQRRIDSNLLQALREKHGKPMAAGVALEKADVGMDAAGFVDVDIKGTPSTGVLAAIRQAGGTVVFSSARYQSVTARVPIDSLETLAASPDVRMIYPKALAETLGLGNGQATEHDGARAPFADRAANVRAQLKATLPKLAARLQPLVGTVQSQGDLTHGADVARSLYGYDGTGVRIGVLSDSVDHLAQSQTNGNLGAVTVVPGMSGVPGSGEGTAMLEIIHDVAPGAQLFFASAFVSEAAFASNITALRAAPYNCDIIVDDVGYFDEPVFEDGIVAQAVDGVLAGGGMYFSSAANGGDLTNAQSGTWEGDFADGGTNALTPAGNVHLFSAGNANDRLTANGRPYLFWSDKFGASGNDYDLFVLNDTATSVVASSTNLQTGTGDPLEFVGSQTAPRRIVILKKTGAAPRYLHLDTNRGRLAVGTAGQTHGHSAANGAFAVAATPAAASAGGLTTAGPYPGLFTAANTTEYFSSDGTRRMFYDPSGNAYTPGDFSSTGGAVRQKPDITAADGVTTSVPGFAPFYGTSAAAPHAAAIAGLLKQLGRTPAQIRTDLTSTAIDIMGAGTDRDSGAGIIMANAAFAALAPTPVGNLFVQSYTGSEGAGNNGNGWIDPGENATLSVTLQNGGAVNDTSVTGTLSTSTPGVSVTSAGPTTFGGGTIPPASVASGDSAFGVHLDPTVPCGQPIDFNLHVTYGGGAAGASPADLGFTLRTGNPATGVAETLDTTAPSGGVTGTTTTGRLNRSGVATSCAAPGSCATFGTGTRQYDAYTFTNNSSASTCVTATLTNACTGATNTMFHAAYLTSFDPANLCTNYLGDAGSSNTTGGPQAFSFNVPAGATFVVVVMEVNNPGAAAASCGYTLMVDGGFGCAAATPAGLMRFSAE